MPHGTINQWYVFHNPIPNKTIKKLWKVVGADWEPSSVDVSGYASDEERISGKKPDWQEAPETRISDVIWCNDQWLYDFIFPFMNTANEEDRVLVERLFKGSQSIRVPQGTFHPIEKNLWQFMQYLSKITA